MKNKLSKLFWGLWCIGVVSGLILSFQRTSRVNELNRIHRDVKAKAGLLKVDDPTKVYVTQVRKPVVPLVLQKDDVRVWQYQVHIPIDYCVNSFKYSGPITADGLRNRGGYSSSSRGTQKEAIRGLWTLTLQKEKDQWTLFHSGTSSSGQTYIRDAVIESPEDFIVKTICPEPGKTIEISPDQFFNLIRIRTSDEVKRRRRRSSNSTPLYPGTSIWIGPHSARGAFDSVQAGSTDPEELAKVILND